MSESIPPDQSECNQPLSRDEALAVVMQAMRNGEAERDVFEAAEIKRLLDSLFAPSNPPEPTETTSPVNMGGLPTNEPPHVSDDEFLRTLDHELEAPPEPAEPTRPIGFDDLTEAEIERLLGSDETSFPSDILANTAAPPNEGEASFPSDILANGLVPAVDSGNAVLSDILAKPKSRKSRSREAETLGNLRLPAWPTAPATPDASIKGVSTLDFPTDDDENLFRKRHTIPPLWRDLTARRKAMLWHETVNASGHGFAFTVHTSDEIDAKARENGRGPLRFIQQRLDRDLKKAMGTPPSWWASLEVGPRSGRYHLHGGIIIPGDTKPVLDALRGITNGHERAAEIVPKTDEGWVLYAVEARMNHNGLLTASMPLKTATQASYEEWRTLLGRGSRGSRWDE